jgi:hypothetical protein
VTCLVGSGEFFFSLMDLVVQVPGVLMRTCGRGIPNPSPEQLLEMKKRQKSGISSFNAIRNSDDPDQCGIVGYTTPIEYHCAPSNRYQHWSREDAADVVYGHITKCHKLDVVERVVYVPVLPGANSNGGPSHLQYG